MGNMARTSDLSLSPHNNLAGKLAEAVKYITAIESLSNSLQSAIVGTLATEVNPSKPTMVGLLDQAQNVVDRLSEIVPLLQVSLELLRSNEPQVTAGVLSR